MNPDPNDLAIDFYRTGGTHAFGIPGGGPSLDWVDSFTGAGGRFITTGHEATAAFMAGAFGRLGLPSAALSIKGPGFANLIPALLSNRYEGYPMLVFSEAYADSYADTRRHKWLRHRETTPWLRHHIEPGPGSIVRRAWAASGRESPSPVLIELTSSPVPSGEADTRPRNPSTTDFSILERSRKPVLLVGSHGLRHGWGPALAQLTIPVMTTAAAKGLMDETSPYAGGIVTGDGRDGTMESTLLGQADCLIGLAVRSGELLNPDRWPGRAERVVLFEPEDAHPEDLFPDNPLSRQTGVLSPRALDDLLGLLRTKRWGDAEIADAKSKQIRTLREAGPEWAVLFDDIGNDSAARPVTHVLDTGNFTVLAEHFLPARPGASVMGTPNGRFMGAGIGYALGASLARIDEPVILWIGDGGVRSYFGELALAAECRLPLLVVCLRDGHYGSIVDRARRTGRNMGPLVMGERGLLQAAEQMGMRADPLEGVRRLAPFIREWMRQPEPCFCEVAVDSASYTPATALFR